MNYFSLFIRSRWNENWGHYNFWITQGSLNVPLRSSKIFWLTYSWQRVLNRLFNKKYLAGRFMQQGVKFARGFTQIWVLLVFWFDITYKDMHRHTDTQTHKNTDTGREKGTQTHTKFWLQWHRLSRAHSSYLHYIIEWINHWYQNFFSLTQQV